MPYYTIRIQLVGKPDEKVYEDLHSRMKKGGFGRTVLGSEVRDLPHGTYYGVSIKSISEMREWTKQQAKDAWGQSILFVAQTQTWAWAKT